MTASSVGVRFVAYLALASAPSCGPGPLPPENPAESLAAAPEPVSVQVETTAEQSPAPVLAPALTEAPKPSVESPLVASAERGFLTPESILYDASSDKYLVSNINGSPSDVDNNGFISIVNPDGSVAQLDFIAGGKNGVTLNAPKGLAIHAGVLYVADITAVRRFDAKTGAPQGNVAFPKATFLNDIVVDTDGTMYVSDTGLKITGKDATPTGTDAIYKVAKGRVSVFAKGEQLNRPNGLTLVNGSLVAVTFGNKQLLQFDPKGNITSTNELPATTLDGVVALPSGQLLVSSWEKQAVYIGSIGGSWSVACDSVPSPADIGFDTMRNRVLVPVFLSNELRFVPIAASLTAPHTPTPPTTAVPSASNTAPSSTAAIQSVAAGPAPKAAAPAGSAPTAPASPAK